MVEFVDVAISDLVSVTKFLRSINPSFKDKLVVGIEKPQSMDRSVVFHLSSKEDVEEDIIFMLCAEYILEHPYWKQNK
jgi:hypothetical protein